MERQLRRSDVTSSDDEPQIIELEEPLVNIPDSPAEFNWFNGEPSDIVDGEIVDEKPGKKLHGDDKLPPDATPKAKSGPPSIDEWMDFVSRICIRTATDFYVDWAFRGVDEEWLTPHEVGRIKLATEERNRIGKPFAELFNKLKFTRKHGRLIIASAGVGDAVIQMGMWFSRVNRIAVKYQRLADQMYQQQQRQAPPRFMQQPPTMQERTDVSSGQGEEFQPPAASANGHFRPDIGGIVINPNIG